MSNIEEWASSFGNCGRLLVNWFLKCHQLKLLWTAGQKKKKEKKSGKDNEGGTLLNCLLWSTNLMGQEFFLYKGICHIRENYFLVD